MAHFPFSARRARSAAALLAVPAVALAAAGCGGGGNASSAGSAAAATTTATATTSAASASTGGLPALQKQYISVVRKVGPSVVQIETSSGLGSGIVLDKQGHIVTNAHVVGNAKRFVVTFANGAQDRNATLVGKFEPDDLAVIKTSQKGLNPATFANSRGLVIGDIVLAIGNPLGLRSSVTDGIISAIGRTVSEPNGSALPNVIQTSAPINPGNSGGALVDLRAQVVGIPTLAATDPELGGSAAPGIGFAIPSNMVKDIASQIVEHGRVVNSHRAFLGVQLANTLGGGALIAAIVNGGPADKAGLKPGESILSIAGQKTPGYADVAQVLATLNPGQTVKVKVGTPSGGTRTVDVKLGQYPSGG